MKRKRGRPPKGSALVEKFSGSEEAKEKMKVIVGTLTGELTMEEACVHLGVGETRLCEMRDEVLRRGLASVEPKQMGRPAKEPLSEEERRIQELQARVDRLELELEAAHLRAKIALVMPHMLKDTEWIKKKG